MHGVRRVKNPEEVEKKKKAEMAAKVTKYCALIDAVKKMQQANVKDAAALTITGNIISVNPEYYTMWNYRREILIHMFETDPTIDKRFALEKELGITEEAIKKNSKCYWIWNHRMWATKELKDECNWKRELELCAQMLNLDSRNFHCWNYRTYVVKNGNCITSKENFDFTTKKIEQSFSNYSAWQQRSSLLPIVYSEPEALQKALEEEFELVKSAFYTEPSDQSAWFYHRWLRSMSPTRERLEEELRMCDDLLQEEPSSKWALLTKVFIFMEMKEDQKGLEILDRLAEIDPLRKNFYIDYKTRITAL